MEPSSSSAPAAVRKLHPSSALIGIFANDPDDSVSRPIFRAIDNRDGDIDTVIGRGDFFLGGLKSGARWRLQDCRNGVLLLHRDDDSLWVYNPAFKGQPVQIQPCPDHVTIKGKFVAHCLLNGTVQQYGQRVAVDSFRVVSMQQCDRRNIRAVEYDSSTGKWHCHPLVILLTDDGLSKPPEWGRPMYAAGHIFWEYNTAFMYALDTHKMKLCARQFPKKWILPILGYSIGEIEDGKGCLVCIRGLVENDGTPRLQVWSLNADNIILKLDHENEFPMRQLKLPSQVCRVSTVINGLAVITDRSGPKYVVDLHKKSLVATFNFSGRGHPYQLSWAPSNIDNPLPKSEESIRTSHDVVESVHEESDGDERSKLSPSNKMKEPPTLSYLDNTCSQSQYMDPPDANEGSDNEAAPCENYHTLKSPDNPKDDEPRRSKRRKTNATSNVCLGERTMGHQDQDMPSLSSCDPLEVESETVSISAVRQNNSRVPCRDILVGQQATSQDTPLNEDVSNSDHSEKSRRKESAHPKGARTRSSHVVRDITSAEAETTSMPVHRQTTCRNSSIGRPATQEKPVCKKSKDVQDKLIPCTFESDSCYMKFKTLAHLNSHVKNIHNLKKTPLVCRFEGCIEVFNTRHEKSLHQKSIAHVEVGTEPQMYKCHFQGCTNTFPKIAAVNGHFRKVHGQVERFLCTLCNSTLSTKDSLDRHCESRHKPKETPLACGFEGCREVFFVKQDKKCHEESTAHVGLDEHKAERIKCIKGCLTTFSEMKAHNLHYRNKHQKRSSRGVSGRPRKKKT